MCTEIMDSENTRVIQGGCCQGLLFETPQPFLIGGE